MSILVLVAAALVLGLLLIPLLGRGERVSPAARASPPLEAVSDLAWVRDHGIDGFERMLVALFEEMGFTVERGGRARDAVELDAYDPTPIRGGRLHVHGAFADPGVPVGAEEVRSVVDAARAESVGKAVLVTLGRFSSDAREAAKDEPIDLVDGDGLAALVRKHLPQVFATRSV